MLGAKKGDPNCQYMIGNRYHQGSDGLPKSPEDAKRWWLAAAEQGHAVAEFYLAGMLREEGNNAEYLRYLRSSASKGLDGACCMLGKNYYKGKHGIQRSTEEAIHLVTPPAERGHPESMELLGIALCIPDNPHLSPPVPCNNPNFSKGVHWLRRAAEIGNQSSITGLEILEKEASSKCFCCNKASPHEQAFLRCSRCRAAWYCRKDCQVQHWETNEGGHKQVCINWK